MSDSEKRGSELLAERLCAAYISAQMGFSSVDYVVKKYLRPLGKPPSDVWFQIAEFVSDVMTHAKPLPNADAEISTEKSAATAPAPTPTPGRSQKCRAKRSPDAEK